MKSIVVTGANGFVGANVVRSLVRHGFTVHAFVRAQTNLWRLHDILQRVHIHEGVLSDKRKLRALLKKIQPYALYHFAAYGSYPKQRDEDHMVATNISTLVHVLDASVDINYKRFLISGSSSEYGKKTRPMKESDSIDPNNMYAATKAAATMVARVFARTYHKPVVITRLFNVYGYYEEEGRLVRSVIESVLNRKPVMLASGREARDFIFAEDIARAYMHITSCTLASEGEIFNIGTGIQTTIQELAEKVIRISGINVPIQIGAYEGRPWDTFHWKADMRKTHMLLGWRAKTTLDEGLARTIRWYQKNIRFIR